MHMLSGTDRPGAEEVETGKIQLDGGERVVSLRRQLGIENVGLNVFVLRQGEGSRIHRHREQEEIYLVLQGELTVELEGRELQLGELEVARVAPDVKRQLWNRGEAPCVLVAIGAEGRHTGGDAEAFGSWHDPLPRRPSEVPLPGLDG